jgi:MoxR-like ATPase
MAIHNWSEDQFRAILKQYFTPARAISSPEFLRGRQLLLNRIDRAFNSEGKHLMIFGDRGVGKTSLARTAAFLQHKGHGDPPTILCESTTTAMGLLRDIAIKCLPPRHVLESKVVKEHKKIGVSALGYEAQSEIRTGQVPVLTTVNEAISVLQYVSELNEETPVILIDELDLVQSDDVRRTFAGFLHNVSDQEIKV